MMKKVLIMFFGLVCLYNSIQSQTYQKFPENNFVWNYWLDYYDGGPCSDTRFIKLYFGIDTIINSQTYHTLLRSTTIYVYPSCPFPNPPYTFGPTFCDYIRQDTIQMRLYRYDTILELDTLLIDFNLSLGQIHPRTSMVFDNQIYVSSIDSILLGDNLYHKVFNFKYVDSLMNWCDDTNAVEFVSLIEGVGYTRGFSYGSGNGDIYDVSILTSSDCDGMWAQPGRLKCFGTYSQLYGNVSTDLDFISHKDSVYYDSTAALCNITLAIENLTFDNSIRIYPNPTSYNLYLSLPQFEKELNYNIFDIHGRTILKSNLSLFENRINVSMLPAGLYFLQVETSPSIIKFIKQ